jgi:hypothetical protein
MKLKTFLIAAAVIYLGFGAGLVTVPAPLMSIYGLALDPWGQVMARILGTALVAFALVFWWMRESPVSDASLAVMRASFIYNVLDLPIIGVATMTGVMTPMGWQAAGLHLLLAIGFGYFSLEGLGGRVASESPQVRRAAAATDRGT